MALTKGAGVAMQIFSIPFVAYGFVGTLSVVVGLLNGGGLDPWAAAAVLSLLLGIAMLRSGKRAANMPQL